MIPINTGPKKAMLLDPNPSASPFKLKWVGMVAGKLA
jgi:hypothetical protein